MMPQTYRYTRLNSIIYTIPVFLLVTRYVCENLAQGFRRRLTTGKIPSRQGLLRHITLRFRVQLTNCTEQK